MELSDAATPSPLIPAGTVVVIRDGEAGLETLMLRRNKSLRSFGGVWVFPGGRVDEADCLGANDIKRAEACAMREAQEEAGLNLTGNTLIHLSQWIPPTVEIRRFSTHFFVTPMTDEPVTIDEGEIHDYRWVCPKSSVQNTPDPNLKIFPPTYVTLWDLAKFDSVAEAMEGFAAQDSLLFETLFVKNEKGPTLFWRPDAGYDTQEIEVTHPRHRLFMGKETWHYQREF